ncbi:MAG: aconitase family protein [Flavonifractor plautii]
MRRTADIDQAVIGSCTNGRMEDMRAAAAILKGRKVATGRALHRHPRHPADLLWMPCTRGCIEIFIEAGCAVSTPTCGPCLGGHMGILADRRAGRLHHQPQLRGPHGPCGLRESILANPACGRGFRRDRLHHRSRPSWTKGWKVNI